MNLRRSAVIAGKKTTFALIFAAQGLWHKNIGTFGPRNLNGRNICVDIPTTLLATEIYL